MKKVYLYILAFASGCVSALLTANVSHIFYILLPILAFIFGRKASRKAGICTGFLLFSGYSLVILAETYNSSFYPLPYYLQSLIGCLGLLTLGFLSSLINRDTKRWVMAVFVVIAAMVFGWSGYYAIYGLNPEIKIEDPYSAQGEFKFTLRNLQIKDTEVDYYWALIDPWADFSSGNTNPGKILPGKLSGQGHTELSALEAKTIVVEGDGAFYAMYVSLYKGARQVGFYHQQKSPYDWDYSVLPPVKIHKK